MIFNKKKEFPKTEEKSDVCEIETQKTNSGKKIILRGKCGEQISSIVKEELKN